MLSVVGTYQDGHLKLDKDYSSDRPIKVIVTFLEDVENLSEKRLFTSDFSFAKSKKILESFKGSLSDAVIADRRES